MTETSFLPVSAPFGATELAQLDTALAGASAVQRAWLAGFLAGLDAQGGQAAARPIPVASSPQLPLTVLFASESGNAETLARRTAKLARGRGLRPTVLDFADLDLARLPDVGTLLVIAATWGEGEPPSRAAHSFAALMSYGAPRLEDVRFGVLGLGDTSYAEFCLVARQLDERLEALGAHRVIDRVDCDLDFAAPAAAWAEAALGRLAPAPTVTAAAAAIMPAEDVDVAGERVAEVIDHVNLNSSRSGKETIHLALAFEAGGLAYEPGDSLDLVVENDPALVEDVIAAAGLTGDDALRATLRTERDITTLSPVTAERFLAATGHTEVRRLIEAGEIRHWAAGRQMIDLLAAHPAALTAEQLIGLTRKLPPRAYSIASSRGEVGDEAHLLVAAIRYQAHGRARTGVASGHVADRTRAGSRLRVRLRPNPHFRLPTDSAADIVMIGPGTGVAPFRAFVQERRAAGATGRSWLFFGARRFADDFLYQLEWQEALEDGALTRIDVAFSRDQPEKVYVQDRIRAKQADLIDWLEGGASLYVCGDAKAMAKDVRRAIVGAYAAVKSVDQDTADAYVTGLERARRYQQDVY